MTNEEFAEALVTKASLSDENDRLRGVIRHLEADNIVLRARVKNLQRALINKETTQ